MQVTAELILSVLPHREPFRFVDGLNFFNADEVEGYYTYREELEFFKGHFPGYPVVPGVILEETISQIGSACLGIYNGILAGEREMRPVVTVSTNSEFLKPVFPNDTVTVRTKKIYYRFGKLKSESEMFNQRGELVCRSLQSGYLLPAKND